MLEQLEQATAELPDDQVLDGRIVPWFMLGIPRLHALLATGNTVSKTTAGLHAAAVFPSSAGLCTRAINHRAGRTVAFTTADTTANRRLRPGRHCRRAWAWTILALIRR